MNRRLPLIVVVLMMAVGGRAERSSGAPLATSDAQQLLTLQHGKANVRERIARALGAHPAEVGKTVPALLKALRTDRNQKVRNSVRSALIAIGKRAVPHIVAALHDWPSDRLHELVVVLAVIGSDADSAVPDLLKLLKSRDAKLRRSVTFALNIIQPGSTSKTQSEETEAADEANPERRDGLGATASLPSSAEYTKNTAGQASNGTRPSKIDGALEWSAIDENASHTTTRKNKGKTKNEKRKGRRDASATAEVDSPTPEARVTPLFQQLAAETDHQVDNVETAYLASGRGKGDAETVEPKPVVEVPQLVSVPATVRTVDKPRRRQRPAVKSRQKKRSVMERVRADTAALRSVVAGLFTAVRIELIYYVLQWIGLVYAGWLLIFRLMPVLFLETDLRLQRPRHSIVAKLFLCWIPTLRALLLLPWLCRSRYAISAWIDARAEGIVKRFWTRDHVQRHAGYVAAPVRWNGEFRSRLTARDLRLLDRWNGAVMHIAGPSGSGKSALAVEMAGQAVGGAISDNRLLPVFLQPGMEIAGSIREQVLSLLGIAVDESARLGSLLQRIEERCVLLIIDEQNDSNDVSEFINAVRAVSDHYRVIVVASDEELDLQAVEVQLIPLTPSGDLLQEFVSEYLTRRGYEENITDVERDELCVHVNALRTARPLPLLLLTMCIDEYYHSRANDTAWEPPESVVELLRRHVEWQLTRAAGSGFTPDELRQDIEELAKMSTAKAFQPQTMRCDAVLKHLMGWNAAHRLDFLENQLQLIEIDRSDSATVRFWDNQVAVRLAAEERRAALDLGGNRWFSFLRQFQLVAQGATANVELFALALYDCCVASKAVRPDFVLGELGELAGLEVKRVQRDLVEQQTEAAVSGLGSADQQTRFDAVVSLRLLALRSDRALTILIDVLCDFDKDTSVVACDLLVELGSPVVGPLCERLDECEAGARLMIANCLQKMGTAAQSALPSMMRLLVDGNDTVRAAAVSAIAAIAPDELLALEGLFRDDAAVVRAECAEAFGTLGTAAEGVADTMTALLDDETEQVRLAAVMALGQIGFASVDVVTGLIKALIDKQETVRSAAEVSLAQLRGQPVNSAVPEAVRDTHGRRGPTERTRRRSLVSTR